MGCGFYGLLLVGGLAWYLGAPAVVWGGLGLGWVLLCIVQVWSTNTSDTSTSTSSYLEETTFERESGGDERTVAISPHDLRAMPYKEYLRTSHWKRRRAAKLRAADHRCQLCNNGSGILDVHHRTYERLGEELDEDLTVLCRDCHSTFHKHRRLERRTRVSKPSYPRPGTVDPNAQNTTQGMGTPTKSGMEKHTVSVGIDRCGETVTFTAKKLGTAYVNGGNGADGGLDVTFYRLPDGTYRALSEVGDVRLLVPSNFAEALGEVHGEPVTYWSWTFEEAKRDETYGEFFTTFMSQHPEGRKRNVRDLD